MQHYYHLTLILSSVISRTLFWGDLPFCREAVGVLYCPADWATHFRLHIPDGDTEYFDIVAGVLQGDKLAPYLYIICLDYVLRTSIDKIRENGFELTKKRSRRYPAKTITDADNADDIAILANTPSQAETLLHSLEWASMSMHTKLNICAIIKRAAFPH